MVDESEYGPRREGRDTTHLYEHRVDPTDGKRHPLKLPKDDIDFHISETSVGTNGAGTQLLGTYVSTNEDTFFTLVRASMAAGTTDARFKVEDGSGNTRYLTAAAPNSGQVSDFGDKLDGDALTQSIFRVEAGGTAVPNIAFTGAGTLSVEVLMHGHKY